MQTIMSTALPISQRIQTHLKMHPSYIFSFYIDLSKQYNHVNAKDVSNVFCD
jgi:hypothetical protein